MGATTTKEKKTHWKKYFNYDYLGSYSLPNSQDVILTIKETKKEMVTGQHGKKEECFVCHFQENQDWVKPMILNRTNCKTIEKIYTPYTEDWPGKKIRIGIEAVNAFGEKTEGLRVRPQVPQTEKPELKPDMEAWASAIKYLSNGNTLDKIESKYRISNENREKLIDEAANQTS